MRPDRLDAPDPVLYRLHDQDEAHGDSADDEKRDDELSHLPYSRDLLHRRCVAVVFVWLREKRQVWLFGVFMSKCIIGLELRPTRLRATRQMNGAESEGCHLR